MFSSSTSTEIDTQNMHKLTFEAHLLRYSHACRFLMTQVMVSIFDENPSNFTNLYFRCLFLLHEILPRHRHRSQAHWCNSQVLMNNVFPTNIGEDPEQSDQPDSLSRSILTIKHTFNRSRNGKKLVASNCIACKAIVFSDQAILST